MIGGLGSVVPIPTEKTRSADHNDQGSTRAESHIGGGSRNRITTTGWLPSCSCDAPTKPSVVLDCFAGAGTVGLVADRLGRDSILIEISEDYARMAEKRIRGDSTLFADVRVEIPSVDPTCEPPIPSVRVSV